MKNEALLSIFKVGDTDNDGRTVTSADLDELMNAFASEDNPDVPLVVGHPANDKPRYGTVSDVIRINDTLLVKATKTNQDFMDAHRNGSYPKISLSYRVKGGVKSLRHIGFLGAVAPAIKGLQEVNFNDEEGVEIVNHTFERTEDFLDENYLRYGLGAQSSAMQKGLTWLGTLFKGDSVAIKEIAELSNRVAIGATDLEKATSSPSAPAVAGGLSFSENKQTQTQTESMEDFKMKEELAKQKKDLDARAAEQDKRDAQFAAREKTDNLSYADSLVSAGNLQPPKKEEFATILNSLGGGEQVISFASKDAAGKETKQEFSASEGARRLVGLVLAAKEAKLPEGQSFSSKDANNNAEESEEQFEEVANYAEKNKCDYPTARRALKLNSNGGK